MPSESLIVEPRDGYTVLTMNRPQVLNALSVAMIADLAAALRDLAGSADGQVVILTGAGKAFCAGMDVDELKSGAITRYLAETGVNLSDMIAAYPGPVIAAINGATATGGFEMASACDIILAGESGRFVDTHSRIGLVPGWGLSQRLYRAVGIYRAKELAFTSRSLSAREAADWGLVNRVVADDELMPAAREMAATMITGYPGILPALKTQINEGANLPLAQALAFEKVFAAEVLRKLTPANVAVHTVGSRRPGG